MSIKDIVVKLDDSEFADQTLATALGVTTSVGASLTAIYPEQSLTSLPYVGMAAQARAIRLADQAIVDQTERKREKFVRLSEQTGVSLNWQAPNGDPDAALIAAGRLADLVVVPQGNIAAGHTRLFGLSDDTVLTLGRPCLVIPFVGGQPSHYKNVLIAWDGSQSCTRAVHDAIPLMQKASQVSLMQITEPKAHQHAATDSINGMCAHLRKHGVTSEAITAIDPGIGTASMLLNQISDSSANLLVMGCYGHGLWREQVFGGVTREILETMTVPTLLSH